MAMAGLLLTPSSRARHSRPLRADLIQPTTALRIFLLFHIFILFRTCQTRFYVTHLVPQDCPHGASGLSCVHMRFSLHALQDREGSACQRFCARQVSLLQKSLRERACVDCAVGVRWPERSVLSSARRASISAPAASPFPGSTLASVVALSRAA